MVEQAMDDFAIARALHVAAVVLWIGGVGFVTLVAMPAIRHQAKDSERLNAFHALEKGFAGQARIWVLIAGLSGFWMVWRTHMWDRFTQSQFWWMWAMVVVWAGFATMLFVIEPFFLHKKMAAKTNDGTRFARMEKMHRIALAASMVAVIGAVGGAHGAW